MFPADIFIVPILKFVCLLLQLLLYTAHHITASVTEAGIFAL